jgi:hypothetical protein
MGLSRYIHALIAVALISFVSACDETEVEDKTMPTWDTGYSVDGYGPYHGCGQADLVMETLDGGFLASGAFQGKVALVKVGKTGGKEWSAVYPAQTDPIQPRASHDMIETGEGYTAVSVSPWGEGIDVRAIGKTGSEISYLFIPMPGYDSIDAVSLNLDKSMTVAVRSGAQTTLFKIDPNGITLWMKFYSDPVFAITRSSDKGCLFATGNAQTDRKSVV